MWMRGRSASRTASQARSMSRGVAARARPAMTGPWTSRGDRLHGLEVARRGDREAGLDDVDAEPRELLGDLELLGEVQQMPGDCSPSRSVVSKMTTRSGSMVLAPSRSLSGSSPVWVRGSRPPRVIPPEGGGEEEGRDGAAPWTPKKYQAVSAASTFAPSGLPSPVQASQPAPARVVAVVALDDVAQRPPAA